jgi:hypothetical protein
MWMQILAVAAVAVLFVIRLAVSLGRASRRPK